MEIPRPLLEDIVNKKCIPFIGAGFSLNAELPPGKHMVDWNGLVTELRADLGTKTSNPLEIAQEYEDKFGRPKLIETLEKILNVYIIRPGKIHRNFVKLGLFEVIYTTNFDKLLENACSEESIESRVIPNPKQISLLGGTGITNIIKMHGELPDLEYLVFTKQDYSNYNTKYDTIIAHLQGLLTSKTVLFLGYSLQDPNFQQIKQIVEKMMGSSMRKSYIVLLNADQTTVSEYEKMNLHVINLPLTTKTKTDLLLEFINEISNYKSPQILQNAIEVRANKSIVIYGETLGILTKVSSNISEKPIILTVTNAQNEIIYKGPMDRKIETGISNKNIIVRGSKWHVDEQCKIIAECDGKTATETVRISKKLPIVVVPDNFVYVYGQNMNVTIVNSNHIVGIPINLEIYGPNNELVYKKAIPIRPFGHGLYSESILVGGKDWTRVPNSRFKLVAEYDGQIAETFIFTSHVGAVVQLDQKVYTWTDRVYITIVAPAFNRDQNIPDIIGDDNIDSGKLTISTKGHTLSNYKLVETGPNTGIFAGYVILTGAPDLLSRDGVDGKGKVPNGNFGGEGPTDGLLPSSNNDKLVVSFEPVKGQKTTTSASIRWNVGTISWLKSSYSASDEGVIQIIDKDMNLDPKEIDEFDIQIWSDSDPNGTVITMQETREDTGIFQGKVKFITDGKSSGNCLKVMEGDAVTAQYIDRTLPSPYSAGNQIRLTASSFIGTLVPPLKRITVLNSRLHDSSGNTITSAKVNQEIQITSDLVNEQSKDQPFTYFVQVQNDEGLVASLTHTSGTVLAKQDSTVTQRWIPTATGTYIIQIFVWRSIENPNALCPPTQIRIHVM